MQSPVVRIKLRVRRPDGSRAYLKPVYTANHKLRPLYALVEGRPVQFCDGVYHLRYQSGGRRIWESVGSDAQLALTKKAKRERALAATAAGIALANDAPSNDAPKRNLDDLIAEFLGEVELHRERKTLQAHRRNLTLFRRSTPKTHIEDLDRRDVLEYMLFLRSEGNGAPTVAKRVMALRCFFRHFGADWPVAKKRYPQVHREGRVCLLADRDRFPAPRGRSR